MSVLVSAENLKMPPTGSVMSTECVQSAPSGGSYCHYCVFQVSVVLPAAHLYFVLQRLCHTCGSPGKSLTIIFSSSAQPSSWSSETFCLLWVKGLKLMEKKLQAAETPGG